MALRIFTGTSIVTTGNAITAATNDTIIIAPNALYAATGAAQFISYAGIAGASGATNISIQVNGTLAGIDYGINMAEWSPAGSNTVTVGATGLLIGDRSSAIYAAGIEVTVVNYGEISSFSAFPSFDFPAIDFDSDRAYLFNAGTIFASQDNYDAVNFQGTTGGTRPNILINTGEIISTSFDGSNTWAFRGGFLNFASDQIWNSGLIVGSIFLDQGNDIYQGGGRVVGQINGGGGNDQIIGGAFDDTIVDTGGGNWLVGGDGDDTITIGNSVNDNQIDHVFGGIAGGTDTSLDDTLVIDLGETASGVGNNVFLEAGYVTMVGSGSVVALFSGFENVTGTGLNDALIGTLPTIFWMEVSGMTGWSGMLVPTHSSLERFPIRQDRILRRRSSWRPRLADEIDEASDASQRAGWFARRLAQKRFSFEKAISIGLKSGLRVEGRAARAGRLDQSGTLGPLWLRDCPDHDVALFQFGTNLADIGLEGVAIDRTIDAKGASMALSVSAPTKVVVFQWPCGTAHARRSPFGQRPRLRAMLVEAMFRR